MQQISETDLILNADGSIYHLNLLPQDIADTVITVGDPDRVGEVSKHFDHIELKKGKREFITHTGTIAGKRLTVLSTGIGTDNIDIVLNELDALVNIDFATRTINKELRSLNIIRIGTSGAVQPDVDVNTLLASEGAFGLDALDHYYQSDRSEEERELLSAFTAHLPTGFGSKPYYAPVSQYLLSRLASDTQKGITVTAPGFYAPQGRQVRAKSTISGLLDALRTFSYQGQRITNLEMETAGIYSLADNLGHNAISFNVILANRATHVFSDRPAQIMELYIADILQRIVKQL